MSQETNKKEDREEVKCERCGLSKSEWNGRWQDPLCKVGKTSYDTHKETKQEKCHSKVGEDKG